MQRRGISKRLVEILNLRRYLTENLEDAYQGGILVASPETSLPERPAACSYDLGALLGPQFLPENHVEEIQGVKPVTRPPNSD